MRALPFLATPLLFLTGCSLLGMPAPQPSTGSGPNAPASEAPAAPAANNAPASAPASAPAPAATPQVVSVSLKNNCKETVKLFFGKKPKFGSGTYSTLGSNTRTSKQMKPGDMIWIVDEGQNGVSSYTVSAGSRDAEITDSCTGWKG
jgi:hypothetical protein